MMRSLSAARYSCCLVLLCSFVQLSHAQPSGTDISSALAISVGQSIQLTGDRVTRPHVVYSISLPAGQLFTLTLTRLGPWTSMGSDTVARASLYAPGIPTVQVFNPSLASAEVGDYAGTGVLNSYMAVAGQYYLDVQFFTPGQSIPNREMGAVLTGVLVCLVRNRRNCNIQRLDSPKKYKTGIASSLGCSTA